jgi:DnaJ-class molecular chaperone
MLYHPDKSASYLSPNIATHIMAIYTGAMEILLDAEMRESFDEQWKRGWGSRDFKKWQRAQEMEKLGEVNTWTVLKETRVGDLRKIRFGGL